MTNDSEWVIVGQFGKVHGIKGMIKINSYTNPRDNILDYKPWFFLINNQWQSLNVVELIVNDHHMLAKIEQYPTRELASTLTHVQIAIKKDQLPTLKSNEFYWHDLIGLNVTNTLGENLGIVKEILATGSNDVLVVEGEKRHLVPYLLDEYIITIDITQKTMLVDWDSDF